MNIDYLETYLEVIRSGSFSETAKKLSISQPAVSFQIQKLERDLGVRLIDRAQKSVTTTEAGKRLQRFAETVARERARLTRELDQMREEVTGTITVAASTIPGEVLLPPILGEFKSLHSSIATRVDIHDSLEVIAAVQAGSCDVGFCGVAPEGRDVSCFKVGEDRIVLIVFPEHPFATKKKVSLQDLAGEPFILREETSGTQRSLKSLLTKAGVDVDKLSVGLVVGTSQAVVAAVEARVGIAFVSNLAIERSAALGLVREVPVGAWDSARDFYCVYRKERVVSRLVSEFISFVQAKASQLG